jgi:sec-independent protein translocase protein TatA
MPIGIPELLIVLVIILLIFGAKRLPELGRSLGGGMREFKDSVTSKGDDDAPATPAIEPSRQNPVQPADTQVPRETVDAPLADPPAKPAAPPAPNGD